MNDINPRKRDLLIALESSNCFDLETFVILLGVILPFSEIYFFNKLILLILKILNFVFANKKDKEVGKKLLECLINFFFCGEAVLMNVFVTVVFQCC